MRLELTRFCLQDRCSTSWSYIAIEFWTGREADAPLQTPRSRAVTVLPGMSHAPIKMVVGVGFEPTFQVFQTSANPPQLSDLD